MKNITDFNKFKEYKKLNEETYADPRAGSYGGGGDTYFANVKGNMAGWENTLIGAGVAKLFGFFRRKVNEGILFLYKKALFREYLASVLRYAAKNNITGEDPNALYKVRQIENLEGTEVEGQEIEVKFTNEKKLLSLYLIGSKVIHNEKPLTVDGKYFKIDDETSFNLKDGIITEIFDANIELPSDEEINTAFEEEDKTILGLPISEFEGFDPDIFELIKKIDGELKNLDTAKIDELKKEKDVIKTFITEMEANIVEMNKSISSKSDEDGNSLDDSKLLVIKSDLKNTEREKKILNALVTEIDKAVTPKPVENKQDATKPVENKKDATKQELVNSESYNFIDSQKLNEEFKISKGLGFRGVKLFGVDKKLADEVGNLDMSILDNKEFAKKFESKEVKDGVTAIVKENYAPIVKIQLAAERMWADTAGETNATLKLKNTWARMTNDVLTLFSRYMFVDQVSPDKLRGNAPDLKVLDQGSKEIEKGAKDQFGKEKLIANPILGLGNDFPKSTLGSVGILKTTNGDFVYINDEIKIHTKKYSVLKIIGIISDTEKLANETDPANIKNYITYKPDDVIKRFGNKLKQEGGFSYSGTYIIKFGDGKLTIPKSTTEETNTINLFNIYSDGTGGFKQFGSNFVIYYYNNAKNEFKPLLKSAELNDGSGGGDQGSHYTKKIKITGALHLKDATKATEYGINVSTASVPQFSTLMNTSNPTGLIKIMESLRKK